MGRKPKPDSEKALSGTLRPDRLVGDPVPLARGIPEAVPSILSPPARPIWEQLVQMLAVYGLMTDVDTTLTAMLSNAIWDYQQSRRALEETGAVAYGGRDGQSPYLHPNAIRADKREADIKSMLRELNLTPATRDRLLVVVAQQSGTPSINDMLDDPNFDWSSVE